jgi:hypothetical protein
MFEDEFKGAYGRARKRLEEDSRQKWADAVDEIKEKFEGKELSLYYDMFMTDDMQLSFGTEAKSAKYRLMDVTPDGLTFEDENGVKVRVRTNGNHKVNVYDTGRLGFKLCGGSVHIYFFED